MQGEPRFRPFALRGVLIAFAAARPAPAAPAASAAPAADAAALRGELDALKARVAELEAAAAQADAAQRAVSDVEARCQALFSEVERLLRAAESQPDVAEEVGRLAADLERLRSDLARAPAGPAGGYRPRSQARADGLELRSDDGRFAARLGGRLQLRYQALRREQVEDEAGFLLRKAKVITEGHAFSPALGFKVQLEAAKDPMLEDYYADYTRWPLVGVRFGQFKVPIVRQRIMSSGRLQFTDRSEASEAFDRDRDVGVMLHGAWRGGWVEYEAAVLNGSGENATDDNTDKLLAGRVRVSPWGPAPMIEGDPDRSPPAVTLGIAGAYDLAPTDMPERTGRDGLDDTDGDGLRDNTAVALLAAEIAARWRGASLQAEAFVRREDPGTIETPDPTVAGFYRVRRFRGFYAQAGYFVLPGVLEVAGRFSRANPHHYGAARAERESELPRQVREFAGVLSYVRFGHHLKAQTEYALLQIRGIGATAEEPAGGPTDRTDHRVRVQLQVDF